MVCPSPDVRMSQDKKPAEDVRTNRFAAEGRTSGYPRRAPAGLRVGSWAANAPFGGAPVKGVSLPNAFPQPRAGVKFAEVVQLSFQRFPRAKITKKSGGTRKERLPRMVLFASPSAGVRGGRALAKTFPSPPNGQVGG